MPRKKKQSPINYILLLPVFMLKIASAACEGAQEAEHFKGTQTHRWRRCEVFPSCSANSGNKPSEPRTSKTHRLSLLILAGSEVVEFKRKYSVSGVKYFIGLPVKGEQIEKVYVVVEVYKWWPKCQLLYAPGLWIQWGSTLVGIKWKPIESNPTLAQLQQSL